MVTLVLAAEERLLRRDMRHLQKSGVQRPERERDQTAGIEPHDFETPTLEEMFATVDHRAADDLMLCDPMDRAATVTKIQENCRSGNTSTMPCSAVDDDQEARSAPT